MAAIEVWVTDHFRHDADRYLTEIVERHIQIVLCKEPWECALYLQENNVATVGISPRVLASVSEVTQEHLNQYKDYKLGFILATHDVDVLSVLHDIPNVLYHIDGGTIKGEQLWLRQQ